MHRYSYDPAPPYLSDKILDRKLPPGPLVVPTDNSCSLAIHGRRIILRPIDSPPNSSLDIRATRSPRSGIRTSLASVTTKINRQYWFPHSDKCACRGRPALLWLGSSRTPYWSLHIRRDRACSSSVVRRRLPSSVVLPAMRMPCCSRPGRSRA